MFTVGMMMMITVIVMSGCKRSVEADGPAKSVPIAHSPAPSPAPRCVACRDVHYARAVMAKPVDVERQRRRFPLAPMLFWRMPTAPAGDPRDTDSVPPAGVPALSAMCDSSRAAQSSDDHSDEHRNVVYRAGSTATVSQRDLAQVSYIWRSADSSSSDAAAVNWTGVRMTLDDAGAPVIWEVLDPREQVAPVFVSKRLEAAARKQFGQPLPGNEHAIEAARSDAAPAVVARILADGPEPMGPMIYADSTSRQIETIICRCMASQVDEIAAVVRFELKELDEACGYSIIELIAATDSPDAPPWWHMSADANWLERVLRLPDDL